MSSAQMTPEVQYQLAHEADNRSAGIIAACTIMLVVAYIAVGLRLLSRRLSRAGMGYDDWMMLVGLFLTTSFIIGCYVCVHLGMGRHAVLLTNPTGFAQAVLTTEVLYTPASTAIKFSILLMYRRLFPIKKMRLATTSIACFLIVFALAQMLSVIIQCTPPAALWDPTNHPGAHCDNYAPALLLFAIINAITDVVILCLPMPILWNLHIPMVRKWHLIGMFCLGGLVCVVSICRSGYVTQVDLTDPSWNDIDTVILSGVENCAGCLCACLPTLLPLWKIATGKNPRNSSQWNPSAATMPSHQRSEKDRRDSQTHFIHGQRYEQHSMTPSFDFSGRGESTDREGDYKIKVTKATTVESDWTHGGARSFDDDIGLAYPANTHKASVTSAV